MKSVYVATLPLHLRFGRRFHDHGGGVLTEHGRFEPSLNIPQQMNLSCHAFSIGCAADQCNSNNAGADSNNFRDMAHEYFRRATIIDTFNELHGISSRLIPDSTSPHLHYVVTVPSWCLSVTGLKVSAAVDVVSPPLRGGGSARGVMRQERSRHRRQSDSVRPRFSPEPIDGDGMLHTYPSSNCVPVAVTTSSSVDVSGDDLRAPASVDRRR